MESFYYLFSVAFLSAVEENATILNAVNNILWTNLVSVAGG